MKFNSFEFKIDGNFCFRLFITLSLISFLLLLSQSALAAAGANDNDVIGETLCRVVNIMSGNIARAIATIAIFFVGISLFMGKMQWGTAAMTAIGIGLLFGAPQIVALVGGMDNASCADVDDNG